MSTLIPYQWGSFCLGMGVTPCSSCGARIVVLEGFNFKTRTSTRRIACSCGVFGNYVTDAEVLDGIQAWNVYQELKRK